MDEIKKYSKIFGLTPDLLTQILRHFKEKFPEVIIKSINDYEKYEKINTIIISDLKINFKIHNYTHQIFIIILLYFLIFNVGEIIEDNYVVIIDDHNDCLFVLLCFDVIKYYTDNILYDINILLFFNNILLKNSSFLKFQFINNIIVWTNKYKNYNFLILLDYLFTIDFFNNIKCFDDEYFEGGDNGHTNCNTYFIMDISFHLYAINVISKLEYNDDTLKDASGLMVQKLTNIHNLSEIRFLWIKWVYFNFCKK